MNKKDKKKFWTYVCLLLLMSGHTFSQTFTWISSTEDEKWKISSVKMKKEFGKVDLVVNDAHAPITFKAWGMTFNELGWDALRLLPLKDQKDILQKLVAPNGDLGFTLGRIPMNANDYACSWYSCDEVAGDFHLKYFNIERDKERIIPFIHEVQSLCPDMRFWTSPWSPPSWMKINADYPVRSDQMNTMDVRKDYILYEGEAGDRDDYKSPQGVFPAKLAVTDYMIQDPRYLQTYADYFSRFISAYQELGISISMVMFQNESWSYTPYPGCAWKPESILRFNVDYLAPTLRKNHPGVEVYLGTINTNRYDLIESILSDERAAQTFQGVAFQWEGGQILPRIRKNFPQYKYVQSESECGWGTFDWKAAEHTFQLINHYLQNGCEEYTFWNVILSDDGTSTWGWKQNALIRVNSETREVAFTPEYYAVKHYTHYIRPGDQLIAAKTKGNDSMPVLVYKNGEGKYVIVAGNLNDEVRPLAIKIGDKVLKANLKAHSCNTFLMK